MAIAIRIHDVEEKLIYCVKPLLLLARLLGYFPFQITNAHEVRFSIRSAPVCWVITVVVLRMFAFIIRFVRNELITVYSQAKNPTERFAEATLSLCVGSAVILINANLVINGPCHWRFWKQNVKHLHYFTKLGHNLHRLVTTENSRLHEIRSITNKSLAVGLAYGTILLLTSSAAFSADMYNMWKPLPSSNVRISLLREYSSTEILTFAFAASIMLLTTNLHFSFPLLLSFYPKVYAACFKLIGDEVVNIRHSFLNRGATRTEKAACEDNRQVASHDLNLASKLENMTEAFDTIHFLVREYTEAFELTTLIQLLLCLVTALLYIFCSIYRMLEESYLTAVWFLVPAITYSCQLYILVSASAEVIEAAKVVRDEICRCDLRTLPAYLQIHVSQNHNVYECGRKTVRKHSLMQLQMFVTRISSDPPCITPGRYFVIDRPLLTAVSSTKFHENSRPCYVPLRFNFYRWLLSWQHIL